MRPQMRHHGFWQVADGAIEDDAAARRARVPAIPAGRQQCKAAEILQVVSATVARHMKCRRSANAASPCPGGAERLERQNLFPYIRDAPRLRAHLDRDTFVSIHVRRRQTCLHSSQLSQSGPRCMPLIHERADTADRLLYSCCLDITPLRKLLGGPADSASSHLISPHHRYGPRQTCLPHVAPTSLARPSARKTNLSPSRARETLVSSHVRTLKGAAQESDTRHRHAWHKCSATCCPSLRCARSPFSMWGCLSHRWRPNGFDRKGALTSFIPKAAPRV